MNKQYKRKGKIKCGKQRAKDCVNETETETETDKKADNAYLERERGVGRERKVGA